jgi:hypothetical protein
MQGTSRNILVEDREVIVDQLGCLPCLLRSIVYSSAGPFNPFLLPGVEHLKHKNTIVVDSIAN